MDTNWCLTCSRPVPQRHGNARPAPYCSQSCQLAAYSSPPSPLTTTGPIPHLLRAYPTSPTSAKPRAGSFASTASTASTTSATSREEWANTLRASAGLGSSSSSSDSVSSTELPPGRPRAQSSAFPRPSTQHASSAPIHPAAASYIYPPRLPPTGPPVYAAFTADMRAALPPTPPKSAESVRRVGTVRGQLADQARMGVVPPAYRGQTPHPHSHPHRATVEEEEEEDPESAFHGRGHDREYYHRQPKPLPGRYAYMDTPSFSGEPRESRDRVAYSHREQEVAYAQYGQPGREHRHHGHGHGHGHGHTRSGGPIKPIRIVGTDEGPGVKRVVGGFGEESEDERDHGGRGREGRAERQVGELERGRGRERRR